MCHKAVVSVGSLTLNSQHVSFQRSHHDIDQWGDGGRQDEFDTTTLKTQGRDVYA